MLCSLRVSSALVCTSHIHGLPSLSAVCVHKLDSGSLVGAGDTPWTLHESFYLLIYLLFGIYRNAHCIHSTNKLLLLTGKGFSNTELGA